jgi:mannosyltransferase
MRPVTTHQARQAPGITPLVATLALLAFAVAIWLRVVALGRDGFWLDEIYSASFANLSALGTVIAAFLFDPHPPLYYLQLNAWGRLGHADFWLLLNSVTWSAATLLAVFLGTTRRFGSIAGLMALCFCGVMGSEIFFADELRMYSMYGCLSALSWIAANRLRADYRWRTAVPLIVILAMMGAIHSASILGASAALLYALPETDRQQLRRLLPRWVAICAVVALTYVPWVINASLRHVAHTSPPTLQTASHTIAGWIIGYGDVSVPVWAGMGTTVFVALSLVAIALTLPALSRLIFCFIAWPLLFGAALSIAVQPIWLDRTFAFCAPFVAIAYGVAVGDILTRLKQRNGKVALFSASGLAAAAIAASAWLGYVQVTTPYKPDHYRELARYLDKQVKQGEIVYAPDAATFWGVSRYLIGPEWGTIFQVQDSAELSRLKKWQRLYALLGPDTAARLGLLPTSRSLQAFRAPLFLGSSPLPDMTNVSAVWLVVPDDMSLSGLRPCAGQMPAPLMFGRLLAYRVTCP